MLFKKKKNVLSWIPFSRFFKILDSREFSAQNEESEKRKEIGSRWMRAKDFSY